MAGQASLPAPLCGLHHRANFFGSPLSFRIVLADCNPFRQINGVWCHRWMAPCRVSFDVQNPWGAGAPGNGTFTGHVFLFAHGHCELQWDHTRAGATDFLAHNTCGTRACCAPTETTSSGLTTHPWVRYHLSFLQVHCHTCASLPKHWPLHKTNKILLLPWAAR